MASFHQGVVFDLFGTLVDAPTRESRRVMAQALATTTGAHSEDVETLLVDSRLERHDGRLPTRAALASYLARRCGAPSAADTVDRLLRRQAAERLEPDDSVIHLLHGLRARGMRLGVLSDAPADIAQQWERCPLAPLVDAAVFSCQAHRIKPHPDLYALIGARLDIAPERSLYCGDGGGDELRGAASAGFRVIGVQRRGRPGALAFGVRDWSGPKLARVEDLPSSTLFGAIT